MSDELIVKALNGDSESQFNLGRAYALGLDGVTPNPIDSIMWLEAAGDKIPQALHLLIGISMGHFGTKHPALLIRSFQKLAYVHKDVPAMVTMGAILCGSPENRHINPEVSGIPELASRPYYNPEGGFRLIEEGVRLAENMAKNPLGFSHYDDAFVAYHFQTHKVYNRHERGEPYFPEGGFDNALAKKFEYAKKALAALRARNGTASIPEENIEPLITMYEDLVRKM